MKTEKRENTAYNRYETYNKTLSTDVKHEQACCGRSYNELNDFSQITTFNTYKSILDQRNELLSGVKPQTYL